MFGNTIIAITIIIRFAGIQTVLFKKKLSFFNYNVARG
jgi:hypothetical protein